MDFSSMKLQASAPLLYTELSSWWRLFTPTEDYREEASFYRNVFIEKTACHPKTLLELGSGGGNNASFLKQDFQMTLVDLSEKMVDVSREINPECEHIIGDMRTVRLNRLFDGVFVHDAVSYMKTEPDLYLTMETAYLHCRPGGIALFAPDFVRESFQPSTSHGGIDGEGRGIRYLEWTYDPNTNDSTYIAEFAILMREEGKETEIRHDYHELGLFRRSTWITLLEKAGFQAEVISATFSGGGEMFIGKKL